MGLKIDHLAQELQSFWDRFLHGTFFLEQGLFGVAKQEEQYRRGIPQ